MLGSSPYNVEMDQNNAHAAYDMFGLSDEKDIVNV